MPQISNLTDKELEALKECSFEAFFWRSLPLMSIFGGGTYVLIRSGKLNPHHKWGSAPKVILACSIAYFLGQFSYQRKCNEKFMRIPDSNIGELLREQERGEPFFFTLLLMNCPYTRQGAELIAHEALLKKPWKDSFPADEY